MRKMIFVLFACIATMAFVACSSDEEQQGSNERRDIAISHGEAEMVRKNNDFALRLVQAIQDGSSQVVSPLSATLVLAMINGWFH